MDDQKFNLILDKLLERTQEGKIEWKTTANQETFLAVLQDSSISINRGFGEYEGVGYSFDFRNENGEVVASVTLLQRTADIKEFEKASKIFDLAQQNSFMNNKTIDRILEQLAA